MFFPFLPEEGLHSEAAGVVGDSPPAGGGVPAQRAGWWESTHDSRLTIQAFDMIAYIVRRMLYAIPILIGVNLVTFALFFFVNSPDDMARMQLGVSA